jgi:HlyD family secretion protein
MRAALVFLFLVLLAAGGGVYYTKYIGVEPPPNFRKVTVTRGDLLSTITSTGTIEPEELVDVGAQVMGQVVSLGIDPSDPQKKKTIDWTTPVEVGTILLKIDDTIYKENVAQAVANLDNAKATVDTFKANLVKAQATEVQAEREWKRALSLLPTNAIAKTDYDVDEANYLVAKAGIALAEAGIKQSEAGVKQCQAALDLNNTNLAYCTIKSPVRGVIVDRRVNIGQTVVSSLNTPSLFLIAKDLRRLQVWASVNEADIGRIRPGMPAEFTVDAFPNEVFKGKVEQVRLNATMTQNVVTYTVEIVTDNSNLRLLPYLTTNVNFQVERRHDVLMVPNSALRWRPRMSQVAPELREAVAPILSSRSGGKAEGAAGGKGPGPRPAGAEKDRTRGAAKDAATGAGPTTREKAKRAWQEAKGDAAAQPPPADASAERREQGHLWVQEGNFVRNIDVRIGATDGTSTEVSSPELKDGTEVVIGEIRREQTGDATNPFAPKLFQKKAAKGG